jgi:predicted aminopeptidase
MRPDVVPVRLACLWLLALCSSGCSLLELAGGQLALINDQVPLARAVSREQDPERRALLSEVPAIVAFAEDVVGLHAGQSYRGYFETERSGLTYVVTACQRTRFEAYSWWFPIVGTVEYRSYWDEADAKAAALELEAAGYDTWISPSRAYSSLGILRDPITTTMLRDGLPSLVEVIVHELSHAKLFIPGHTEWNEALASFVGERGAERYFQEQRFAKTNLQGDIELRAQRRVAFDQLVTDTYTQLETLYDSQRPLPQKLAARNASFEHLTEQLRQLYPEDDTRDWRINNARLLHFHRYTANSQVLTQLWRQSGQEFRAFWRYVEAYSKTSL